ncbi:MAG: serine/threonine protein kinase [Aphanocapsa lilacina HA4352-LM1]|jgi:serine/threonine protein kinase|nr:serine/threonine protein kinase [Aphanocapsa lilacina HA4352-LM1]
MPFSEGELVRERYRLCRHLGVNGGRETWLAADGLCAEASVTLKTLYFGRHATWQDHERLEREARTLASLDYPGIPRHRDAFWVELPEGHYYCLAQEYIAGITLAERVGSGERLGEADIVRLAAHLLETLAYLHSQAPPVIHRDIKPSNIVCTAGGGYALIDFGSVQAQGGTTTLTVAGTFSYMPPEQFIGRAAPGSDLYALGATLLFALTGTDPADFPRRGLHLAFQSRVGVGRPLVRWLERLLEPAIEERLGNAREALEALEHREVLHATGSSASAVMPLAADNPWKPFALLGGSLLFAVAVPLVTLFGAGASLILYLYLRQVLDPFPMHVHLLNALAIVAVGSLLCLWWAKSTADDAQP